MKFENFDRAKSIVESINSDLEILNDLDRRKISVMIVDHLGRTITNIGAWQHCDHYCSTHAVIFIATLKSHYLDRIKKATAELETL
jgi:hypothetical protein